MKTEKHNIESVCVRVRLSGRRFLMLTASVPVRASKASLAVWRRKRLESVSAILVTPCEKLIN